MNEKDFRTQRAQKSADVIDFYDRYADTWDMRFGDRHSTSEFHRIRLSSFLQVANLKQTDHIVELGVGTGPYLSIIAPLVNKVICVDGSSKMLEKLQQKYPSLSNTHHIQMDLELVSNSTFPQADLLYCFGLIEHIIDIDTFLLNCRRMLKIGGRIIFVTPNGKSPWYGPIRKFFRAGRHCSTDIYYTKEQLSDVMARRGFIFQQAVYWGYFPADVGSIAYHVLRFLGQVLDRTPLRQYAGGLTVSFVLT